MAPFNQKLNTTDRKEEETEIVTTITTLVKQLFFLRS